MYAASIKLPQVPLPLSHTTGVQAIIRAKNNSSAHYMLGGSNALMSKYYWAHNHHVGHELPASNTSMAHKDPRLAGAGGHQQSQTSRDGHSGHNWYCVLCVHGANTQHYRSLPCVLTVQPADDLLSWPYTVAFIAQSGKHTRAHILKLNIGWIRNSCFSCM